MNTAPIFTTPMAVGKGCIKRISTIRQIINGHNGNYCCPLKLFKQKGKARRQVASRLLSVLCFYSASRRGLEVEVHCQVGTEVLRAELECAR